MAPPQRPCARAAARVQEELGASKQASHCNKLEPDGSAPAGPHAARIDPARNSASHKSSDTEQQPSSQSHRLAPSTGCDTADSADSDSGYSTSPDGPKFDGAVNDDTLGSCHSTERSASTKVDGADAPSAEDLLHAESHNKSTSSDSASSWRSHASAAAQLCDSADITVSVNELAQPGADDAEQECAASHGHEDTAAERATAQPDEDGRSSTVGAPQRLFVEEERALALFHRSAGVSVNTLLGAPANAFLVEPGCCPAHCWPLMGISAGPCRPYDGPDVLCFQPAATQSHSQHSGLKGI